IRRPEGEPRYYVVPGSSRSPFYLRRDRRVAVVVESELDALAVYCAAGDLAGAYAIGNDSAKPDARSVERLSELAVLLISTDFDSPDHNGSRPGTKAAAWWLNHFDQARRWPVPMGKDPGDAFQAGLDLRAWIMAGLPLSLQPGQKAEAPPPIMEAPPQPQPVPVEVLPEATPVWPAEDETALPWIGPQGGLHIPINAPLRFRWWQGGQSPSETLKELLGGTEG
ncbi:MAG: hypothetical protein AB7F21_07515, partial [Desulfuromonadales bacterium]